MIPYAGEIAGLATAALWAFASFLWPLVVSRIGPIGTCAFRTLIGFALVTVAMAVVSGSWWPAEIPGNLLLLLALSGLVGLVLGDSFYFAALKFIGPRRTLLMRLTCAPMSALLCLAILDERISLPGWLGIALTLAGIAIVQGDRSNGGSDAPLTRRQLVLGSGAGLLESLGQAVAALITKMVLVQGISPFQVPQVRLAAASCALLAYGAVAGRLTAWSAAVREPRVLVGGLAAILIGTCLGLMLMTYSQAKIPVGLSNTLVSTSPLFALPMAMALRGERIGWRAILGTITAFAGVLLIFKT